MFRILGFLLLFTIVPSLPASDLQALPVKNLAKVRLQGPPEAHPCGKLYPVQILESIQGVMPAKVFSKGELRLNADYLLFYDPGGACGEAVLFFSQGGKVLIPKNFQIPVYMEVEKSAQGNWVAEEKLLNTVKELNEGC